MLVLAEAMEKGPETPLEDLVAAARPKALELVDSLRGFASRGGAEDERWYWAAPLLLDRERYPHATGTWRAQPELASDWSGKECGEGDKGEDHSAWGDHVERVRELASPCIAWCSGSRGSRMSCGTWLSASLRRSWTPRWSACG